MSSDENKNNIESTDDSQTSLVEKMAYYFDIIYRVLRGLFGFVLLLLVVVVALAGGAGLGYFASLVKDAPIPTHAEMESQVYDFNQKSTLYYADNSIISDVRSDLIRTPISLEDISPFILNAVIATEDENFYEHEGVVPKAIVRAAAQELSNAASVSGGSTITQQLIKQQILSAEVTHSRKAIEILYATHLENSFEKDEILEAYMNISPFGRNNRGQNIAGVEEAAQGIFGVSANEVTLPQAAFIAGLPKSPISYSPYTQYGEIKEDVSAGIRRQKDVLYSLFREGYITQEDYEAALNYDITQDFLPGAVEEETDPSRSYVYDLIEREGKKIIMEMLLEADGVKLEVNTEGMDEEEAAQHIAEIEALKQEYSDRADLELRNGGYKVFSTIDPKLHNAIEKRIKETQDSFGPVRTLSYTDDEGETRTIEYPTQVGGSLIENATGRVLAFVGGRDYEVSEYNIAFDSRRGTGSAIKPLITYGPALAENFITPATVVPDTELIVKSGNEDHNISNVGRTTNEWRDARHWLKMSQNIPNTKIYLGMLDNGINPAKYIRAMGIGPEAISDNEFYQPSTSLGGTAHGPTITEVAGAYAAIGNKGVFNKPHVIERIEKNGEVIYEHEVEPVRVWSEATNYVLYDMLREVARSQGGTATSLSSYLNLDIDLASKTGTTNETRDVWYAGVTPTVTLTTWMGYDDQRISLPYFEGLSPARRNIRNWANILNVVHSIRPELVGVGQKMQPPADGSVVTDSILVRTGMKPGKVELPNNRTITVSGATKSEIFKKDNVPGVTTFDFAIGAKPEEISKFWQNAMRTSSSDQEENEDDTDRNDENSEESTDEAEDSDSEAGDEESEAPSSPENENNGNNGNNNENGSEE